MAIASGISFVFVTSLNTKNRDLIKNPKKSYLAN